MCGRPIRLPSIHGQKYEVYLSGRGNALADLWSYVLLYGFPASQDVANRPEPTAQQHLEGLVAKNKVKTTNKPNINENKKLK